MFRVGKRKEGFPVTGFIPTVHPPVSLAMYCYSLEIQTYGAVGGIALYI